MSNSLLEMNELANQLPPSDISEKIERHTSLLVSVLRKVVTKVSLIEKDLNCKSTVIRSTLIRMLNKIRLIGLTIYHNRRPQ